MKVMSKFQVLEEQLKVNQDLRNGYFKEYDQKQGITYKDDEKIRKQKDKLKKEFEKKVRKLFGRVKVELSFNDTRILVRMFDEQVFKFTYDTFTFKNIEKELAVELQYLYLEYYGEPKEVNIDTQGCKAPTSTGNLFEDYISYSTTYLSGNRLG